MTSKERRLYKKRGYSRAAAERAEQLKKQGRPTWEATFPLPQPKSPSLLGSLFGFGLASYGIFSGARWLFRKFTDRG